MREKRVYTTTMSKKTISVLLMLAGIHFSICAPPKNRIDVDGNGYVGVTIAISRKLIVTRDAEDTYLNKLKQIFTAASAQLYRSTKNHLYFKEIKIVVPPNWTQRPEHEIISGPQFDRANIILDEQNPTVGSKPYVIGMTKCGESALDMRLEPYTVLRQQIQGILDKSIVHQWGHLRWGLFDEYPDVETPMYDPMPISYLDDGTHKPNVCSDRIQGQFRRNCLDPSSTCSENDGVLETGCFFCPSDANTVQSSIMGYHSIPSIGRFCAANLQEIINNSVMTAVSFSMSFNGPVYKCTCGGTLAHPLVDEFCDEDRDGVDVNLRHSPRTDTLQNTHCQRRSAWEVMRTHSDFTDTTAGSPSQNTTPTFRILQQVDQRFAIVMDVSGSMNSNGRFEKLISACTLFLSDTVEVNSSVSLVVFNSKATIIQNLTKITSDAVRQELISRLPTRASGGTSIGAGLEKGLEALAENGQNVTGSMIILVTDGQERAAPYIDDVKPRVVQSGVILDSLAITDQSDDKLIALAADTGGRSFLFSGNENSTALLDAFTQSSIQSSDSENTLLQIESQAIRVSATSNYSGNFVIDSSIGKDTFITFTGENLAGVRVTLRSPNTTEYTSPSTCSETCQIRIPGLAEIGTYQILTTSTDSIAVSFAVLSHPRSADAEVIRVTPWMNVDTYNFESISQLDVYAYVTKGLSPVLDANVAVLIEDSLGGTTSFVMRDDGAGGDLLRNDGLYMVSIGRNSVNSGGRYNVKLKVENTNGGAKVLVAARRRKRQTTSSQGISLSSASVENFQRISQGGEFNVINYNATLKDTDTIPPSPITSLTLVSAVRETANFSLRWIAVGDDFYYGTATSYDIRLSTDFNQLVTDPDSAVLIQSSTLSPNTPGVFDYYSLSIPNSSVTYFVGIRAVDDSGNKGELSNIISLSVITDPIWLPGEATQEPQPKEDNMPIIPLTIVSLASVLLIIAVAVVIYLLRLNHKTKRENEEPENRNRGRRYVYYNYYRHFV